METHHQLGQRKPVSKGGTAGRAGTPVRNKECRREGRRAGVRPEPDSWLQGSCLREPGFII